MNITKPTIIVDEKRMRRNIEKMSQKARNSGVRFRPHFKSHQSAEIGEIFREYGITAITTSSLDMAAYFAQHGWDDITVAVSVNIRQIETINKLAGKISLGVLIDSVSSAEFLAENVFSPLKVWIEIDSGEYRTGMIWDNTLGIENIARLLAQSDHLAFAGILTHAGQSYDQNSVESVKKIHRDSLKRINSVRDFLISRGFSGIDISTGDTPTCSIIDDFAGTDEIRPGSFVFNDLLQVSLGSCMEDDIAVVVACPVISKHPERKELVIYGGGAHLGMDCLLRDGTPYYGLVALPTDTGWTSSIENAWLTKITQEHGTVRAEPDFSDRVQLGDILMILPIHSCLTANLHQTYRTIEGKPLTSFHYELI